MSEITVRALTEDEWETYRSLRLEALQESPEAFVADHATEDAEASRCVLGIATISRSRPTR